MRPRGWPQLLALPMLLPLLLLPPAVPQGLRCPQHAACQEQSNVTGDYLYLVEGKRLMVSYVDVKSLKIKCPANVSLESASLPRFGELTSFGHVIVERCALPPRGLARALAVLRIEPRDSLDVVEVPHASELTAAHLAGLSVRALQVAGAVRVSLSAADDFLAGLPSLSDLHLSNVRLRAAALLTLPTELKSLWLSQCALSNLPRAALARLPKLRRLVLQEPQLAAPPELDAAPALATLVISAPLVRTLQAGPALVNATFYNMSLLSISGICGGLERLTLEGARTPPVTGWATCARLRQLRLSQCALMADAPRDLLRDAPALRELDLSNNNLRDLPIGMFSASLQLERLDLSRNALTTRALAAVRPFQALQQLDLSDNPLGDLCDSTASYVTNDMSALKELRALRDLRLRRAGITRVCRDWRDASTLPALADLDLRNNDITELGYAEAAWTRGTLDLRGNSVRTVLYARDDFDRAIAAPATPPTAAVLLDSKLLCDCRVYWFARALLSRPQHVAPELAEMRCAPPAAPRALLAVPLEELECAVPKDQCVAGCACAVSGERSVLRCAGAALRDLPLPSPPLPPPRALLVQRNNISSVPRDLPPELTLLDLTDNRIAELELETWSALLVPGRRVLLRGNPLRCGCDQGAALALLQARAAQLDAEYITCADERPLLAVSGAACAIPPAQLLGALLGATLLLALLVLACLARPASRHWIKRFLVQHNLCLRLLLRPDREERAAPTEGQAEEDGAACPAYDAFVSFSHHDDKFVTEDLVPHLEGAARPRRLCLHYRDWTPGEWIPTQIAQSVRRSRRTLVVLSEHFLRSSWARAEFREAHAAALRDARPRLVVLLLAPPATLPLDAELRLFLASNTYLRRDDPRFWDKLLDALPAASPAANAAPPVPSARLTGPCA